MSKFKIAVIDQNDISFTETNISRTALSRENISDLLSDEVNIVSVKSNEDLMEVIIQSIFNDKYDNEAIHTGTVSHMNDDLYQICHIMVTPESYSKIKSKFKFNGIATYLTDFEAPVFGPAVLFKISTENNDNKLSTLSMNEIIDLFTSKFVHQGIIINPNGTLDKFDFIFNPVDWITPNEISKYKFVEIELLDKKMMIFYDTTKQNTDINNIGSQLYGSSLFGRLIVALRDVPSKDTQEVDIYDNTKYIDLTPELMKKIIEVFCVKKQPRQMTNEEDINHLMANGKRVYNNFHKIIHRRL